MSTPVIILNISPAMWSEVPLPEAAKLSLPGLLFASAMNSATDFAGTEGFTIMTFGMRANMTPPPREFSGVFYDDPDQTRSCCNAGGSSRLDLVYGFGSHGGRTLGEADSAHGDGRRRFACRAGLGAGHIQELTRQGRDQNAGGFGSAEGMPFPQQQAAAPLHVSRRRAAELQGLAPGGKGNHRLQARRDRERVGQFRPAQGGRSLPGLVQHRQTLGDSSLRVPARFAVNPQRRARGPRRRF